MLEETKKLHERDALITRWNVVNKQLITLREEERVLREMVVNTCFADAQVGTSRLELGYGYALKVVKRNNYRLETKDPTKLSEVFGRIAGDVGDALVRWKPELVESVYKRLTSDELRIVNEVVIMNPATPTLELIEPKTNS